MQQAKVNGKELGRVLGLTGARISQLRADGVIDGGSGRRPAYDLAESVQAYIRYVVEDARGRAPEDADAERRKLQADADYKRAKADQEALKLAELEGRMHASEDVERATSMLVYAVRNALIAMPGRLAVDVVKVSSAQEAAAMIRDECNAVLSDLANYEYDPKLYASMARERKGWQTSDADGDEEDQ